MKNIPLLLKHSFILIGIMLISMATLVWYSASKIMKYSEHEIVESSVSEAKANRELTEEAMENIVEHSVKLASSKIFYKIRDIRSLAEINSSYVHISNALSIQADLVELNKINSGIYSSFFYLDGTDYIISTDQGVTSLQNYEQLNWLNAALETKKGMKGVWFSRWNNANEKSIISFVLPLNSINSNTRGTLVVNISETEFSHYLSSEKAGFNEYILINEHGFIISHEDRSLLYKNIRQDPFFDNVLNDFKTDGYTYRDLNGVRQLVTWSRSAYTGWLNVSIYEFDKQMDSIYRLQNSIYVLATFMIIIGSLLALIVTKKLSTPINKLVKMVSSRIHHQASSKNELLVLEEAFQKMQEEEKELHRLLNEREKDTRDIAVQHLIRGEVTDQVHKFFSKANFLVLLISIDTYRKYCMMHSREARSFHRYKFIAEMDQLQINHTNIKCIYHGDGCYVLILNGDEEARLNADKLPPTLTILQQKAAEIFQQSVTLSVSNFSSSIYDVNAQYLRAFASMKQRMLQGNGQIFYWTETTVANEKRILSFIDQCDFESIKLEIANIRYEIGLQKKMSPDHVLFISHQLVGAAMNHLREKNVNLQRLFSSNKNIYMQLSMSETLDDIEDALVGFYEDITNYLMERIEGEANQYGDKIIEYLQKFYRSDIDFEEMAKEIGISYSYMRKIMIEMTGMSLIDYVHSLRIKQAKDLLKSTQLTISHIAVEVGYNNIRSFNRFFQKVENMTPSVYRSEQYKVFKTGGQVVTE